MLELLIAFLTCTRFFQPHNTKHWLTISDGQQVDAK